MKRGRKEGRNRNERKETVQNIPLDGSKKGRSKGRMGRGEKGRNRNERKENVQNIPLDGRKKGRKGRGEGRKNEGKEKGKTYP